MFDDKENNYNENINNSNNSQSVPGNIQAENHFYDDYKKPERTEENKQEQNMNSQPQQENRYNQNNYSTQSSSFNRNDNSENNYGSEAPKAENKNDNEFSKKEENSNENRYQKRAPYEPIKDNYYRETVKKKKGSFKKVIAACMVVSLFGGTGIGAGYAAVKNLIDSKYSIYTEDSSTTPEIQKTDGDSSVSKDNANKLLSTSSSDDAVAVINDVYPSIVNITINVSGTAMYYGMTIPYESQGAGSGVIFDEDDQYVYIVTNDHVVDGASSISISVTGIENISAEIVGTDSSNDIAVIKVLKSDLEAAGVDYKIAKFGDSDKLNVGESVIAIGNALGEGKSATGGMISVLNKSLELEGKHLTVIQTSAPINPGNSGGALVNYDGEVIGINTAKTDTTVAEGMGYAIPSNTVKEIMEQLEKEGTQPKPYIGIMGSDITDEISQLYKLPVGVLVRQVIEGSPAEASGLQEGDIITAIDDKSVMNMDALIDEISKYEVGTTVNLNVIRSNQAITVTLTIADANNVSNE